MVSKILNRILEADLLPDWLIRMGIRALVRQRLRRERGREAAALVEELKRSPIAIHTADANVQHYEVPAEFFSLVLGPHLKYSCAYWRAGVESLESAEEAMLDLTCRRARLEDGQDVLELGCGWGSLSLYMAARYPLSRVSAVSNSHSQKEFIEARAARRGLRNLQVLTADMNRFDTAARFDRVVSVEMFEHMRNYALLLERIASWSRPGALLFVHIFSHKTLAYPFEVRGASDWMAEHFFTGGLMPSHGLLLEFQDHFRIREQWRLDGTHYQKTAEAWLARLDARRGEALELFARVYGAAQARRWLVRWRVFFLACAGMFGYRRGREWMVSHYLFERR